MKIVNTEQMRQFENAQVDAGVSLDQLMENAGLAIARSISNLLDGTRGKRVVVLVGQGNNGGDGMVAAKYLTDWGAVVTLYLTSPTKREDKFSECIERRIRVVDAKDDLEHWQLASYVSLADVVVDAVLGIGGRAQLPPNLLSIFKVLNDAHPAKSLCRYVAIDIPTGVDADTGQCDKFAFDATNTFALGYPKLGSILFPGASKVGKLETIPIGLTNAEDQNINVDLIDPEYASKVLPSRKPNGHKGSYGEVLVIGGSKEYVNAPTLVAAAAYRSGAGLVKSALPQNVYSITATSLLEQIFVPLPSSSDGGISKKAAAITQANLQNAGSSVIGPGLGTSYETKAFLQSLLLNNSMITCPVVIDADALNFLAGTYNWESQLMLKSILTPHPREMSRLLSRSVEEIQADRIGAASFAATKWQQIVVLKGAHTVIASPEGSIAVSPHINPALSTAGTGDVLAGLIGGLATQVPSMFDAAVCGVFVHGLAAERWSKINGDAGLLASDLLSLIPKALNDLRKL